MITSIGQVMLYVNDLEASAKFWTEQAGFEKAIPFPSADGDGSTIYELKPKADSDVSFVLQDKKKIEKMHPELNLGTPSIMLQTDDLEQTYQFFIEHGVKANPIMEATGMRFFNFPDNEGNYFAIKEISAE
ncbi:VOC family protein [Alloscardovia criceti]|uniref:VOC family protein n=1 Tax=Alloscardovia criceti TaxID=356828 RepID=UPI000368E8BA|nr:VOC family protein [Alloscardovia criceti]